MKKKSPWLVLAIMTMLILTTSCGSSGKPVDIEVNLDIKNASNDETNENKDLAIKIREDEDKLVKITIEDGEATISFDLNRWEEVFNISETAPAYVELDEISEGPFPIIVDSGKIVDAYIGAIRTFPYNRDDFDGILMAAVLLMEDGSLRWFEAIPYWTMYINEAYGEEGFIASDELPHKDDYVSFSYESDGEGIGNKTVYIINSAGDKFDLYYLIMESRFFFCSWICNFPDANSGKLTFSENGGVLWEIGRGGEKYEIWEGSYEYIKTNGREYPIGTLLFDMGGWWIYEGDGDIGYETRIVGSYRMDYEYMEDMKLYHNDGTLLYQFDKNTTIYEFWSDNIYEDDIYED